METMENMDKYVSDLPPFSSTHRGCTQIGKPPLWLCSTSFSMYCATKGAYNNGESEYICTWWDSRVECCASQNAKRVLVKSKNLLSDKNLKSVILNICVWFAIWKQTHYKMHLWKMPNYIDGVLWFTRNALWHSTDFTDFQSKLGFCSPF